MSLKWDTFADQVCDIAERVYGHDCRREIVGRFAIDGLIELGPDYYVAVLSASDLDSNKLIQKIGLLKSLKASYAGRGSYIKCFLVARGDPDQHVIDRADADGVVLLSVSSFASGLFDYGRYLASRKIHAFGSAIDPKSGEIDKTEYIPVTYLHKDSGRAYSPSDIAGLLLDGRSVVLLGEYGTGKSRCIKQVFESLATKWGDTFTLPFAVNLRECWGMLTGEEVIRRHMTAINERDLENSAVKVFQRDAGLYLLDGFDEVGSQAWTTDESRLKLLRAQAMSGVRDIVSRCKAGTLVAGREHYFSGKDEMLSALGLAESNSIVLHVGEEFTPEQMEAYFEAAAVFVVLPEWLPRRPLIGQTIAALSADEVSQMFAETSREAEFWNHFIDILCTRDSRIHTSFDPDTIFNVYVELARKSRNKPMNVGPFSQRDLQEAFEAAVGQPPTEEASVMLQRLPSLGRIGAESTDRQFVDMYILDGLRGRDLGRIPDLVEDRRKITLNEQWMNPLKELGQKVLAEVIRQRRDSFKALLRRASESRNAILAADIVSAFMVSGDSAISFDGVEIVGATFSDLDFRSIEVSNLAIINSIIERLVLPNSPPRATTISRTSVGTVYGASAMSGLPGWTKLESVDQFDSVQTVARIRHAGLQPAQEILVAIIKKVFFQKGAGRKEEALLRGFGSGTSQKTAGKVLNLLIREGIIHSFKGDSGTVFAPIRSQAGRMDLMLKELRSSGDDIWSAVSAL
jgi:hypothetical protein